MRSSTVETFYDVLWVTAFGAIVVAGFVYMSHLPKDDDKKH